MGQEKGDFRHKLTRNTYYKFHFCPLKLLPTISFWPIEKGQVGQKHFNFLELQYLLVIFVGPHLLNIVFAVCEEYFLYFFWPILSAFLNSANFLTAVQYCDYNVILECSIVVFVECSECHVTEPGAVSIWVHM